MSPNDSSSLRPLLPRLPVDEAGEDGGQNHQAKKPRAGACDICHAKKVRALWAMRAGGDDAIAASDIGEMSGKYRLSSNRTARAVSTPTASSLEFEITKGRGTAYPMLSPLVSSEWQLARDRLRLQGPSPPTMAPASSVFTHDQTPPPTSTTPTIPYCDARLAQLDITFWTQVPIGNEAAAMIISSFLQTNHPVWGYIDADLSVIDLVDKKLRFCTPFLVNALLTYICVPLDAGEFPVLLTMLWRYGPRHRGPMRSDDRAKDTMTTLLQDGRAMAKRLNLLGLTHSTNHDAAFQRLAA
ncbi:hypothetical protein GGR57DRAFT_508186 [Xylariaceae sp. FL1272]|nr:hypothetical protein GGR57DRAFT_508186 [Xylariaceae sp. FL1272]